MSVITINELLSGNATIIKNKEYLSAKDYVQPFIDSMSKLTNDFRVKVKLADQLSVNSPDIQMDNKANIVYNRVLVEAVLPPESSVDKHDEVIGFLYGLDIRKHIAKIYRGYLNQACTNLSVFNAEWINYQELLPETKLTYKVEKLLEKTSDFATKLTKLKTEFIKDEDKLALLGEWIDYTLHQFSYNGIHSTKLSPNLVIDAYKSVYLDPTSTYYIDQEQEQSSMFNMYNAMTQVLTDDKKDIMNDFEKTIMIGQMLKVAS